MANIAEYIDPTQLQCLTGETTGVVIVFAVGLVTFLGGLAVFAFYLRKRFPNIYFPNRSNKLGVYQSAFSQVFKMNDEAVGLRCGVDAVLYLQVQKAFIKCLCFMGLLGCVTLLPLNVVAGDNQPKDNPCAFRQTTAQHLSPKSPYYWSVVVFSVVATASACWTLVAVAREWLQFREKFISRIAVRSHTVYVHGIPSSVVLDAQLEHVFEFLFPDYTIVESKVALSLNAHVKRLTLRKDMHDRLEHFRELYKMTGVRPLARNNFREVDAIDFYTERVAACDDALRDLFGKQPVGMGVGFVTFTSPKTVAHVLSVRNSLAVPSQSKSFPQKFDSAECALLEALLDGRAVIEPAPEPTDLIWKNLDVRPTSHLCRRLGGYLVLLLVMFICQVPITYLTTSSVTFLRTTKSMQNFNAQNPAVGAIISSLGPSLVLLLFRLYLPYVLMWLANPEGFHLKTNLERTVMVRYWWFLLINMLALPLAFRSAIDIVSELEELKHSGMLAHIAQSLGNYSSFFLNFVVTVTLFLSLRLVRLGYLLWHLAAIHNNKTSVQRRLARFVPENFEYYVEYADGLSIFAISLLYSSVVPIMPLAGLAYFVIKHYVDKYNILFVHPRDYESGGLMIPSCFVFVASTILLFCIAMCCYMWALGTMTQAIATTVLLPLMTIGTFVYVWGTVIQVARRMSTVAPREANAAQLAGFRQAYQDPTARELYRLAVDGFTDSGDGGGGGDLSKSSAWQQLLNASHANLYHLFKLPPGPAAVPESPVAENPHRAFTERSPLLLSPEDPVLNSSSPPVRVSYV